MMKNYILDKDNNIIEEADFLTWSLWFAKHDRKIERDTVDGVNISTVFMGIDHSFCDKGPPLLFETMVFGGKYDQNCIRTSTLKEAKQCHSDAVEFIKNSEHLKLYKHRLSKEIRSWI